MLQLRLLALGPLQLELQFVAVTLATDQLFFQRLDFLFALAAYLDVDLVRAVRTGGLRIRGHGHLDYTDSLGRPVALTFLEC